MGNLRTELQAPVLQDLCFDVMPCSFQLVPNFLVKNAFFGNRYFFISIFSQISVHIP